jgi:xylulokinase
MNFLGIDIGSSSIKVAVFDAENGQSIDHVSYPSKEMEIISPNKNWAEQNPEIWMANLKNAMAMLRKKHARALKKVMTIGITYQMHGLVMVDSKGRLLRNAIIWCDSRAVDIGKEAFADLGNKFCLQHLLNSPGNFTASKLKWVKNEEPDIYKRIYKIMLPGDYIAYRLTNEIKTTNSGLSEGIFWDFEKKAVSEELLEYFGFQKNLLPEITDTFSMQGNLTPEMAVKLGLQTGIPVSYRAGDQPNNALSLKVLHPGEVATTAGTSGVVYAVSDKKEYDPLSRVNTFLHVNNSGKDPRHGVLLCLNSIGILNSWIRHQLIRDTISYEEMNVIAVKSPVGSEGLKILPFGNGAERILENRNIGASFHGLNFTTHKQAHVLRALQEGTAFAFKYGLEIMENLGINLSVIRAGKANMFLSNVFVQSLANISGTQIELYNTNGAEGAARGAGIGAGYFNKPEDAFDSLKVLETFGPQKNSNIHTYYDDWKKLLKHTLTMNFS